MREWLRSTSTTYLHLFLRFARKRVQLALVVDHSKDPLQIDLEVLVAPLVALLPLDSLHDGIVAKVLAGRRLVL